MVDRSREVLRISTIRHHKAGVSMEFFISNGYEVADTFPIHSDSIAELKRAYNAVCDKFGAVNIDCCDGSGTPRITVLKKSTGTQNAERKYIAVYTA